MNPATTIFHAHAHAHARHRPLALAQDPLRLAFSLASSAVQPPPTLALHPALGPTCWTFDVVHRTAETLSATISTAATTAIAIA